MIWDVLLYAGAALAAFVVIVLVYSATKPSAFRVERAATIRATPAAVAAQLTDFHNWTAWSPWEKLDPTMTRTHSGAAHGVGAVYEWRGNKKVGQGRMEILESAAAKVVVKLDFYKPFEAHNTTLFTLHPDGDATRLTWAMFGPQPYMLKVMTNIMNMDKMVGKDFEQGLANLKAVVEPKA